METVGNGSAAAFAGEEASWAEPADGAGPGCLAAAEAALRRGEAEAAEGWLARHCRLAAAAGGRARADAARRCGDLLWRHGHFAEALGRYLEAEAHLAPPRPVAPAGPPRTRHAWPEARRPAA